MDANRQHADAEAESYREYLNSLTKEQLLEVAIGLSSDASYWKYLYQCSIRESDV